MLPRIFAVILMIMLSAVSAVGQSSAERVRADLDGQYRLMKQIVGQELHQWNAQTIVPVPREFELPCIGATPEFFSGNGRVTALGILAGEMVQAGRIFTWAQYPTSVWDHDLMIMERQLLSRIRQIGRIDPDLLTEHADGLIRKLGHYGATRPRLIKLTWETGCGGTFTRTLRFVTRPPGGTVRYIPSLYYTFCTVQRIQPNDFRECNLWNTVNDGEEANVEGAYWYQVTHKDGTHTSAKRKDFSKVPESVTTWIVD